MLQVVVFYTKKKNFFYYYIKYNKIQTNNIHNKREILYLLNFFSITLSVRSGTIEDWNTLIGDVILVSQ